MTEPPSYSYLSFAPSARIIGIDPGPKPGLVVLHVCDEHIVRVTKLDGPALDFRGLDEQLTKAVLVSMERFVLGRGTARKTKAGTEVTLAQVARLRELCEKVGVRLVQYPAGVVKPWATDDRLRAFGCYVTGNHYRDAVRHALYAAVRAGYLPRRPAPRQ